MEKSAGWLGSVPGGHRPQSEALGARRLKPASTPATHLVNKTRKKGSASQDQLFINPDDLYRIRVGNYRVVYTIRDDRLLVIVLRIADRKDAYRVVGPDVPAVVEAERNRSIWKARRYGAVAAPPVRIARWMSSPWCSIASNGRRLVAGLFLETITTSARRCSGPHITPARKFRMLLHINPTRQRGKRTGSLAHASGWYMTFFAAGVIPAR